MTGKGFAFVLLASAALAFAIQYAPSVPASTLKTQSVYNWVYDPATKETRTAPSGVTSMGYMPAKKFEDPEDVANATLNKETFKKVLAQGK